jgi:hypothetical protein
MLSRHFFVTRVMCELRNHKLLTFVFVIQPLLWLQGIDRLNGLIIILGWWNCLGRGWQHTFDDSVLLLGRSSGNVGVQLMLGVRKDKPKRRVAEIS